LSAHDRKHGSVDPHCPEAVDLEGSQVLLGGEGFGEPEVQVPGVVDHDVDTLLLVDHPGDCRDGGVLGEHVELDHMKLSWAVLGPALCGQQADNLTAHRERRPGAGAPRRRSSSWRSLRSDGRP
jgi:hypothetical protein